MKWKLTEIKKLAIEVVLFLLGGCLLFPLITLLGVIYTFLKHVFYKFDYSISRQLIPILRSFTLASDGLANAGAGELLNDALGVKEYEKIRYGKWYNSISEITGLRKMFLKKDNWLRKSLDKMDTNHCENAIRDENKYYYDGMLN